MYLVPRNKHGKNLEIDEETQNYMIYAHRSWYLIQQVHVNMYLVLVRGIYFALVPMYIFVRPCRSMVRRTYPVPWPSISYLYEVKLRVTEYLVRGSEYWGVQLKGATLFSPIRCVSMCVLSWRVRSTSTSYLYIVLRSNYRNYSVLVLVLCTSTMYLV